MKKIPGTSPKKKYKTSTLKLPIKTKAGPGHMPAIPQPTPKRAEPRTSFWFTLWVSGR